MKSQRKTNMWHRSTSHSKDDGAALALVLVMVVFLSLWMGAVSVLTQSSLKTIQRNVSESTLRSTLVSGALATALNQLTFDGQGNARRWGINVDTDSDYYSRCSTRDLLPYVDGNTTVDIQCSESIYSGKVFPLASYVLVGENCTASSCITGRDGGLAMFPKGNSNCSDFPFRVSGGIINVAGAWRNVDCTDLQLVIPTSASETRPTITQPSNSGNCPAALKYPDATTSMTSGQSSSPCSCPYVGLGSPSTSTSTPSNVECTLVDSTQLSQSQFNDLSSYVDSIAANLSQVSGFASFDNDNSCSAPNMTAYPTQFPNGVVFINPGIIRGTVFDKLNTYTQGCGTTQRPVPIIFKPGVYRFLPDSGQEMIWNIKTASTTVLGGFPKQAADGTWSDCDATKPEYGVELQFTGKSGINMTTGRLSLCPRSNAGLEQPVIAAPTKFVTTGVWQAPINSCAAGDQNGSGECAFITTGAGNASSCDMCIIARGLVYAPGGWGNLSLNGKSSFTFDKGALFAAMSITGTGSASAAGSVAPPPPFTGDRVVQLRFLKRDTSLGTQKDLGVVQVVIKDYFGRRLATGYRIINWRAAW
jgi:hypothetical protein